MEVIQRGWDFPRSLQHLQTTREKLIRESNRLWHQGKFAAAQEVEDRIDRIEARIEETR